MNVTAELINVISRVSPILAAALSSPASSLVISLISKTFGINTGDTHTLIEHIRDDPEASIKLRELENSHVQYLRSLEFQEHQLEIIDRDSARKYNLQSHDWVLPVIAIGYSGLFAGMMLLDGLSIWPIKPDIITYMYSIAMIVVNFYLGSSHGERRAQTKYQQQYNNK